MPGEKITEYDSGLVRVERTAAIRKTNIAAGRAALAGGAAMPCAVGTREGVKIVRIDSVEVDEAFARFRVRGTGRGLYSEGGTTNGYLKGVQDVVLIWEEISALKMRTHHRRVVQTPIKLLCVPRNAALSEVIEMRSQIGGDHDEVYNFFSVAVATFRRENFGEFDEVTMTYSVSLVQETKVVG